ncbi:MAG: hypothetical protein AB8G11_01920 [Saprospiraceae bacterium]
MRYLYIIILIINTSLFSNAQTYKAFVKAGDNALAQNEVYDAYNHFKMAMKIDSSDAKLWEKLAKAAYGYNMFEVADYYYSKIEEEGKDADLFDFENGWLATKMALGDYEAAEQVAQKYNLQESKKAIDIAKKIKKNPIKIDIQHLDKSINTKYSDFAAQKVKDDLFYSSYRFKSKNQQNQNDYTSKLIIAKNLDKGLPLKQRFNVRDKSTANAFWVNENEVYYTICELKNGQQQCQIYHRIQKNNKWQTAKKLNTKINKEGFTNTHPTIAFDSLDNKQYLYFVSDRSGKMTIWRSELLQSGKWKMPSEMQFLDDKTATKNVTPFFDNKTQILYFSSDRNGGLGKLDIYKVERKKSGWSTIQNAGYPLNGSYNDVYFRLNEDSKTGYFSSNRKGSLSLTKSSCCFDIYAFELGDKTPKEPIEPKNPPIVTTETPEKPITSNPPTVSNPPTTSTEIPTEPEKPEQPLTPLEELSQFLPLALYFHNDEPNPRTWKTTTTVDYGTSYRRYYARKSEYVREFTSPLSESEKVIFTNDINDFFDYKIKAGYENLEGFSNILLKHLQAGETIEIVLKGFASPRAKSDYNLNLSQRRVACVRNHFTNYQSGIFKAYLNNGQLKISNSPFGETKAATSVSDKIDDRRNSVYSVGAAKERRVEILEVR